MARPLTAGARRVKKRAFLASFAELANITAACGVAGIDRMTYRWWMEHDPEFAMAVELAGEAATELLEREAHRRAALGTEKPVYQGGELVGTVREYSDVLLIFLLKARAPHKYRDNAAAASEGPAIKVVADVDLEAL